MFGKRPDGRFIRNLEPMQRIMPYIMKTRCDSMNMYEDTFDCTFESGCIYHLEDTVPTKEEEKEFESWCNR